MRQPEHGPGCSVAKPSRPHSFTALVNHTAQVPPARQPVGFDPLTYGAHSMLGGRGRLFGNGSDGDHVGCRHIRDLAAGIEDGGALFVES